MATEQVGGINRDHFRKVTVTALAALFGIGAGVGSAVLTAGLPVAEAARATEPQLLLLALIGVQPLVLKGLGLLKDDFGVKDVLFIAFMTFSMWFLTWGIILTAGVSF